MNDDTQRSILIVEDDEILRDTVRIILEAEGYSVHQAASSLEMRSVLDANAIDLVLMDLVLGQEDGFAITRELRSVSDIPIIILTGKNDVIDRIVGLEIGADDYITKPFHNREFTARIKSVLRRYSVNAAAPVQALTKATPPEKATFGGWTFDLASGELVAPSAERVVLTTYELQVLSVFVRHAKRALSRSQIMDLVANREWDPFDRSLDVLIGKLRRKLGEDIRQPRLIRTMRNIGYMFMADVTLA